MKVIKAIVATHMLHHVLEALHSLPHFPGVTVTDCHGHGRGKGAGGHFQPSGDSIGLVRKAQLEVFCSDAQVDEILSAICDHARTGRQGDGIVVVLDLVDAVRIRTRERHDAAL